MLIGVLGGSRPTGAAAAVAADTGGGSGVTLAAADYVGRPVDEVATQLSGLGLTVQRQQDPTAAVPAGTVTRVDPAGVPLRPGDPVRVSYAVPLGSSPVLARAAHRGHRPRPGERRCRDHLLGRAHHGAGAGVGGHGAAAPARRPHLHLAATVDHDRALAGRRRRRAPPPTTSSAELRPHGSHLFGW